MPNALQIRLRLAEWIGGRISLSEFEDWFVPATWNIHKANDPEAEDLADEIELSLSEYSGGHLNIAQLKESLKAHIASQSDCNRTDAAVLCDQMRTPPPANLPEGGTPAERLDMAFREVLTVPKEARLREEAKEKRLREKRRPSKKAH